MKLPTTEDLLKNAFFKLDKGLVPRNSELYLALTHIKELNETITKLTDQQRASRSVEKNISDKRKPGRPPKDRVGKRNSVRATSSNSKNNLMEGGSKWEVKAEEDQAQRK